MKVERILETCLYVEDLAAAVSFYQDVLGLELVDRGEDHFAFFRCRDAVFLLFVPSWASMEIRDVPAHGSLGSGHVAFRIDLNEVDAWRQALRQGGISIEKEIAWPGGGFSVYFRDPAGNSVELATPEIWGLK